MSVENFHVGVVLNILLCVKCLLLHVPGYASRYIYVLFDKIFTNAVVINAVHLTLFALNKCWLLLLLFVFVLVN